MSNNLKRKASEDDEMPPKKLAARDASDDEDSDDGLQDIVDVDFDFYNPDEIDFHALKKLLTQLFASDAELLELGDFADIMIEENQVGTTVKVDDMKSDPYAILSIINLNHQKCPKKDEALYKAVQDILSLSTEKQLGWVVSERFINMPVEIMPPMYSMLQEETQKAIKENEPYVFEWYMFVSKTYREVTPTAEEEDGVEMAPPSKKSKKEVESEVFYFQSEDEIISQYAEYQFDYKFTNNEKEQAADSRRAFSECGIAPFRRLMFVHASKFDQLVSEIKTTCTSVTA
ncbi:hypothetical protein K501DRAFT_177673 [Backusella circina FSU 941]|nr:hypothetical protein K501DRAFT_177673 [Backusella circina FSU 941]